MEQYSIFETLARMSVADISQAGEEARASSYRPNEQDQYNFAEQMGIVNALCAQIVIPEGQMPVSEGVITEIYRFFRMILFAVTKAGENPHLPPVNEYINALREEFGRISIDTQNPNLLLHEQALRIAQIKGNFPYLQNIFRFAINDAVSLRQIPPKTRGSRR